MSRTADQKPENTVLHRPKILTFVAYYLPSYKSGGPVRSISNIVEHLGDEFDFRIVSKDRDSLETEPYPGIKVNKWNMVGKARVFYASPQVLSRPWRVARLMQKTSHDVLYLNSFFAHQFTTLPLLARGLGLSPRQPCVIAPRGEFSGGALALRSRKKRFYFWLTRILGLYSDLVWQASSKHEVTDIYQSMGKIAETIVIAPNLPSPFKSTSQRLPDEIKCEETPSIRIIFLSRISPKKNLGFALKVLREVSVPVVFDIYGLIDDNAYWEQCLRLINFLPKHISTSYHGVLDHARVHDVLTRYDLFFLPTRGENYGHAIFEALAAGVPALISDQTPWSNLDEKGVGFVRKLNHLEEFVSVIYNQSNKTFDERSTQKHQAREYAYQVARDSEVLNQNRKLFRMLAYRD